MKPIVTMHRYVYVLFFALFSNINIESHSQDHFQPKRNFPPKEIPKLEKNIHTEHPQAPNIQYLIYNKINHNQPQKLDNKPPIFVKNPNTGKIEPCIFVAHDEEELKKNITEKYGPLTDEQYQLILASIPPAAFIPTIGEWIFIRVPGPVVGGLIGGGILTGPVIPIIGTGIGIGLLIKWHKERKAKNNEQAGNNRNNNNNNNNNDNNNDKDPKQKKDTPIPFINKDNKKHPERTYEPNPKHHPNAKDGIGKPPENPEKALDNALKVPGKEKQLITVQDEKIIVFKEHRSGKWHGFVVEKFKDLSREAKNALYDAGLVRDITKGKITK